MEALNPWYVTGLAEGSGVFTYSRSGDTLNLVFAIHCTGTGTGGENELLEALREFFGGAGRVYGKQLRITRLSELATVLRHFDDHPLQGSGQAVYRIWREMVQLKLESFRKPPVARLEELAGALTAARKAPDS